MGLTRTDLMQMQWGEVVLMMQARADEYGDEEESETREATWEEIQAWL